jgi:hypothetical protein
MWAGVELRDADLGDERRASRLMRLVEGLVEHAEQSVPQGCGGLAETRAAYRFWSNPEITAEAILAPHVRRTVERAAAERLTLVAQDTTEINLTRHPATAGLGYLACPRNRGLLVHTCFALRPDGTPLGTVAQHVWARPLEELGKRATRKRRTTVEKESGRWLRGVRAAAEAFDRGPVVVIGDRESDLYDLFAAERPAHVELLVRVCRETRLVDHPRRHLVAAVAAEPIRGVCELTLPRRGRQAERTTRFDVRFLTVGWPPPSRARRRTAPLPVQVVLLEEQPAAAVGKPLRRLLATTLPVHDADDAVRIAGYYARRWQIERFHYVLKSGCSAERLRLSTADDVRRALACFSIAAWRLLWLAWAARTNPEVSCETVLEPAERQALEAVAKLKYGRPIGPAPPTLGEAVRLIARLGGHLGRKCDGPPGVKTLWRGLARLADVTVGWLAAQPPAGKEDCGEG